MVVDTSAILALLFNEPSADWVMERLSEQEHPLMSTVNLAETMMLLRARHKDRQTVEETENDLLASGIRFIPPTIEHARQAALAHDRFPLNIGDCFVYALSLSQNAPILTLDEDFRRCDRPVVMPPKQ